MRDLTGRVRRKRNSCGVDRESAATLALLLRAGVGVVVGAMNDPRRRRKRSTDPDQAGHLLDLRINADVVVAPVDQQALLNQR